MWSSKCQISDLDSGSTICKHTLSEQFYMIQTAYVKKENFRHVKDNITFSEVFKALSMHKVVDRISYSRFLPKSAKSQFGHSEQEASTIENDASQLSTHTVTNMPSVLINPLSSHHTQKLQHSPQRTWSTWSSWDVPLTLHAQKSVLMKERDKGVF